MRQKLFFLFSLMTSWMLAQQSTIWEENFNTEDISAWTIINANGDTSPWGDITWSTSQLLDENWQPIDTPFLRGDSFTMFDNWGHLNPDDWAITPAIDLTAVTAGENIELSWALVNQTSGMTPSPNGENYSVYIATSNTVSAMLANGVKFNESNVPISYSIRTLNLSEFAGQTIYIGFRQHDTDNSITPPLASFIGIDDIIVKKGNLEGCLEATFGQYPQTVFTPSCTGTKELIAADAMTGEYSAVNVSFGVNYIFSSSAETTFITVGNESGTQILASGTGSVTWQSNMTGTIRFYTHLSSACDSDFNQFERAVQCGTYVPSCDENVVPVKGVEDYFLLGGDTHQRLAIDVLTPVNGFTLYGIKPILAGNAGSFTFNIYDEGFNQIDTRTGIIASQTPLFDDFIEYELAFDTPLQLSGNNTYWIEIATNVQGWAFTESAEHVINQNSAGNNDQTSGTWMLMDGFELVYSLVCDEVELSTSELNSFEFSYYPNPVIDLLNFKSKKEIQSVSVYNLAGQQIMNRKVSNGPMNLTSLTSGTYVFRIVLENGQVETFKIVKK